MPRQMRYRDFACEQCGATFRAARSDARFCKDCGNRRKSQAFERRNYGTCPDCGVPIVRRVGRCRSCATKARDLGGENNPYWKGGKVNQSGYVYVLTPDDPTHRYRAEHVLVWEQANGKPVPKGWHVHHLNGI